MTFVVLNKYYSDHITGHHYIIVVIKQLMIMYWIRSVTENKLFPIFGGHKKMSYD